MKRLSKRKGVFLFYVDKRPHTIEQMLDFLPTEIKDGLSHVNIKHVYEIRLRADKPTTVNFNGEYRFLGLYGLTERAEQAIHCTDQDIADCVYKAGEYSVYSVEEELKKGFLTARNGERLGLAGEYVFEKGQPLALRNFTSLCIRVPHEIYGCGWEIYEKCLKDGFKNCLIASPPGLGKTTILRDLARLIGENTAKNVLICDERGEISCGNYGQSGDVLKFADKNTAFDAGIRAMRPDVIITDELSPKDCEGVKKAIYAGVTVLASAHFSEIEYVKEPFMGLFDRYVLLNDKKIGQIKGIYDQAGVRLL